MAVPRRAWARLEIRHLFVVVPLVLVASMAARPIADNSFLWHVRAGSLQLDVGRVLTSDPFSATRAGAPWRTQSWLVELGYGLLERGGGLGWVPWMVFFVVAGALLTAAATIYRDTRNVAATGLWTTILAWLALPFAQPRPMVFGHLLLALVALATRSRRLAWTIVPLLWVWAGIHGSWVLGVGLVVLEAIRRRSRTLGVAAAAGVVASAATAHGLGAWEFLLRFAANRDALELLNEWKAPEFSEFLQAPYVIVIVGLLLAAVRGRLEPRDLVVVVPFLLFGLTTRRAVYPAALVLVPFAAGAYLPTLRAGEGRRVHVPALLGALALAGAILLPLAGADGRLDPERFPTPRLVDAAFSGDAEVVFHSDVVGGYLVYARWPSVRVFIDDRAELYGREAFEDYVRARNGNPWELFADEGIDTALVREEDEVASVLRREGWREVAAEEGFVVLRRRSGP